MKLYLVQHAEACAKEVDPERSLTAQGRIDIDRMADFLKQADVVVERVLHSGKRRAEQTAERLTKALGSNAGSLHVELEISDLINPNDNPSAVDWQSESCNRDTLIVSHLPFISRLVSHLLVKNENQPLTAYTPGSVVCLELVEDAYWQLNWMIRPELFSRSYSAKRKTL